jgi:hypothetical protein
MLFFRSQFDEFTFDKQRFWPAIEPARILVSA